MLNRLPPRALVLIGALAGFLLGVAIVAAICRAYP